MNEIRPVMILSEPRWTPSSRGASNRIREIHGLKSSYSAYPCARVDASIADLVLEMNKAGLATEYCCSALDEDHRNDHWMGSAYIAFAKPLPDSLAELIGDYMDGKNCIRIRRTTDEQLKSEWAFVRSAFRSWSNNPFPCPRGEGSAPLPMVALLVVDALGGCASSPSANALGAGEAG